MRNFLPLWIQRSWRWDFFNKVIMKEEGSRKYINSTLYGLNLNKIPVLRPWVFFLGMWGNCPHLLPPSKINMSLWLNGLQCQVTYSLSGTWKVAALGCPSFVTFPSESVSAGWLAVGRWKFVVLPLLPPLSPPCAKAAGPGLSPSLLYSSFHPGPAYSRASSPQESLVLMTSTGCCRSGGSIFQHQ